MCSVAGHVLPLGSHPSGLVGDYAWDKAGGRDFDSVGKFIETLKAANSTIFSQGN